MATENENLNNESDAGSFTLESIMAEYKGSAYINGDKKTPPDLLNMQAERIIREVLGDEMVNSLRAYAPGIVGGEPNHEQENGAAYANSEPGKEDYGEPEEPVNLLSETGQPVPHESQPSAAMENIFHQEAPVSGLPHDEPDKEESVRDETMRFETLQYETGQFDSLLYEEDMENPDDKKPAHKIPLMEESSHGNLAQQVPEADHVTLFFDNYNLAHQDTQTSIGHEVQNAMESDSGSAHSNARASRKRYGRMARASFAGDPTQAAHEEYYEEPPLKQAAVRFAKECNSISLRCIPAALIAIFMVILTFAFEAGMIIPFGIRTSHVHASGTLLISLLVIMILCIDILVRGFDKLINGTPNAETLILFSCVFSFLSGGYIIIGGTFSMLPYCAVSALSLVFASFGEKFNLRAITETLKTAQGSSEPYGILGEYSSDIDKTILKKAYCRTDGFYNNLLHPDVAETGYRYITPPLLIGTLVLPVITLIARGGADNILQVLSAFFSAAAPFSALLAFSVPFTVVAKASRKSGAAIAGWGGSDDICFTDGACITDDDLFPPGTIRLNEPRIFEGEAPERVIRYSASMVIASGSGLTRVFAELLKSEGLIEVKVEEFECAEGGIRGLIRGDLVETGSVAFMNLIGVRIPDGSNMKNAVYTAINKKLVAVFPVDYTPINSVQGALISILKWRIKIFLAVRDFNVTPLMLSQKYKVSFEDMELIQARDSYAFSDTRSDKEGRICAVLVREGLGPFAEVLTGGRLLKSAALVATILSIMSALFGVLLVFYMCWSGALLSVSPGNLIIFMLCMLGAVLAVCGYVRCRR